MVTMWRPDTCDCLINRGDDGKGAVAVHKCVRHANLSDVGAGQLVLSENISKNFVVSEKIAPLHPNVPVKAEYSPSGELVITSSSKEVVALIAKADADKIIPIKLSAIEAAVEPPVVSDNIGEIN